MSSLRFARIGIAVIVQNSAGDILLGKRKNAHGAGQWAPPGGHLEFGETPIECAIRELAEETGAQLIDPQEIMVFTNTISSDKHYITLFIQGTISGEPRICEPDKCEQWQWFSWNSLPTPLFASLDILVQKMAHDKDLISLIAKPSQAMRSLQQR